MQQIIEWGRKSVRHILSIMDLIDYTKVKYPEKSERGIQMKLNIDNCPRCGKIYTVNAQYLCKECLQKVEEQYQLCVEYLREHRYASIQQLSEGTGVPVSQISKFIMEGRISAAQGPGLTYPCETCGKPIRSQKLCDSCRKRLQQGWMKEEEKKSQMQGKSTYKIKEE